MPQFSNAPSEMNKLMEEVYNKCMKERNDKTRCSKIAIGAAKKAGYVKLGNRWKKVGNRRIK